MYRANTFSPNMSDHGNSYNSDRYTSVSYRRNPGYFEQVGSSCCGITFGILIFLAGFPVLFLNEGRAVQTAKSLDEGLQAVVPLSTADTVFASNDGHLIHLSGKLKTNSFLTDEEFGIRANVVKLRRKVEMYQWVEHEQTREYNEGDRTRVEKTYSYSTEWKSKIINSGQFSNPTAHRNPNSFAINALEKVANPVFVGQFQLSQGLLSHISKFYTLQPKVTPADRKDLVILDRYFYRSVDPYHPKVGDLRISFSYAGICAEGGDGLEQPDSVSIIGRQNGEFLSSYKTKAGDSLELLYYGILSAKEMFDAEHTNNTLLTWVVRFAGWLMMFIGLQIMMDIVRKIVSFIPIVREIVGLATALIAFTIASSSALITIALGWLRYRPLLAASILLAAVVPMYLSRQKAKNARNERRRTPYGNEKRISRI